MRAYVRVCVCVCACVRVCPFECAAKIIDIPTQEHKDVHAKYTLCFNTLARLHPLVHV